MRRWPGAAARRFGWAGGMRRQRSPSAAGPVLLLPAVPARRARPARRRRSPPRLRPVSVAPRRWPAGGMRGPSTPTGGRPSATSGTAPEALASWPLLPVAAGHEARAAGGMSNRCRLCWDERRRFFLPTWTAWLAADLRGIVI